jgi:hypothetical protein
MSKQRALAAIAGQSTDRIPQWDIPDSPELAQKLFDYNIWSDTRRTTCDLLKYFDVDLAHYLPGGVAEWNFPLVRYYHEAEYLEHPDTLDYRNAYTRAPKTDMIYRSLYDELRRQSIASFWGMAPTMSVKDYGFSGPEDVLAFNPLDHEHAILAERKNFFVKYYQDMQALLGENCLMIGWYYNTLFMWPVEIFGWENFMLAAMLEPDRFNEILLQFLEITKRDISAMCAVEQLPVIACHDDLSSAAGPMFDPNWYERYIFPHYHEIFQIIHDAGKKVLFVSDGNIDVFLDRLLATGADGIVIDKNTCLQLALEKFSGKIICGGLDPAIIANGTCAEIESLVSTSSTLVKKENGYFFQCMGMNGKVPVDKIEFYQECLCKYGKR